MDYRARQIRGIARVISILIVGFWFCGMASVGKGMADDKQNLTATNSPFENLRLETSSSKEEDSTIIIARGVLKRILGKSAKSIQLAIIPEENGTDVLVKCLMIKY